MLYNVPGRTACNLLPETVAELAAEPNIVAVKEASGNLDQIERVIAETGLQVFSGDDGLNFQIYGLGGRGTVSVVSNLLPGAVVRTWTAWRDGDIATAWKLSRLLDPTARACFVETSPAPVKELLSLAGLCRREPRLPLMPVTEDSLKFLRPVLRVHAQRPHGPRPGGAWVIAVTVHGAEGRMGRLVAELVDQADDCDLAALITEPGGGCARRDASPAAGRGRTGAAGRTCTRAAASSSTSAWRRPSMVCWSRPAAAAAPLVIGTTGYTPAQQATLRAYRPGPRRGPGPQFLRGDPGPADGCCACWPAPCRGVSTPSRWRPITGPSWTGRAAPRGGWPPPGQPSAGGEEPPTAFQRIGGVVGEHRWTLGDQEETLELTHRAHSRRAFLRGVLPAVRFAAGRGAGALRPGRRARGPGGRRTVACPGTNEQGPAWRGTPRSVERSRGAGAALLGGQSGQTALQAAARVAGDDSLAGLDVQAAVHRRSGDALPRTGRPSGAVAPSRRNAWWPGYRGSRSRRLPLVISRFLQLL